MKRSKELLYYIKKNKVTVIIIYMLITLLLVFTGCLYSFLDAMNYEASGLKKVYEGKAIYQLIDNYCSGDDFDNFRQKSDSLEILKNYYEKLNNNDEFKFLSIGEQHIYVEDLNIPQNMIKGYEKGLPRGIEEIEGKEYSVVKSLQINKETIDYFDLTVIEGRLWNESDFEQNNDSTLPIILGYEYKGVYDIGDRIDINYYFKNFNAEVIGIMDKNSKVLTSNEVESYVDNYIIIPNIDFKEPKSAEEYEFQFKKYFSMVNGFVVTENDKSKIKSAMEYIDLAAKDSGFNKYQFLGINPHFHKYTSLMSIISENVNLLKYIFIGTVILNIIIILIMIVIQHRRRLPCYAIHCTQGGNKKDIIKQVWVEIIFIMSMSFITYLIIVDKILVIGDIRIHIILLIGIILLSIILTIISMYSFVKEPISRYLAIDEERWN